MSLVKMTPEIKTLKQADHIYRCEAPICAGYPLDNLVWYPDEKICNMRPWTKWQKTQRKIAKLAKQYPQMVDEMWSIEMLKGKQRVRFGTSGRNPNRAQKVAVNVPSRKYNSGEVSI